MQLTRTVPALLVLMLSACATTPPHPNSVAPASSYEYPSVSGKQFSRHGYGSFIRIDREWTLTARHNYKLLDGVSDNVFFHPYCDIALVRQPARVQPLNLSKATTGDALTVLGFHPSQKRARKSQGEMLHYQQVMNNQFTNTSSTGEPIRVMNFCKVAVTNAEMLPGMSGGGVFKDSGQLVGVINGSFSKEYAQRHNSPGLYSYIPICDSQVKSWLHEVTGNAYCD